MPFAQHETFDQRDGPHKVDDFLKSSFAEWVKEHIQAILTVLSAVLILGGWLAERTNAMPLAAVLYIAGFVAGGFFSAKAGLTTLVREKDFDVDLLMIVAAIGAASIGYWVDGAILIIIFSLSGTMEEYAMRRTSRDIASLVELRPESATLLVDGEERQVPVDQLEPNDVVLVRAAERFPADGVVIEGYSAVDQASITGESIPAEKEPGSPVFAGTVNGPGALKVEVTASTEATLLARLVKLVQEAQSEKPPTQLFIETFERKYARFVILAAILVGTLPPYLFGWTWSHTIYRAMIFLVVASPCALVASMMPAILSGISNGARHGVLFKGGMHLENMADLKVVAFDKTGTLTHGKPQVTDIVPIGDQFESEEELLALAAALERWSDHPLAHSIVEAAANRGTTVKDPSEMQEVAGFGLSATVDGTTYFIGRESYLHREGIPIDSQTKETMKRLGREGKTIAIVATSQQVIGLLALQDTLRKNAPEVIKALRQVGIEKVVMLTGDNQASGEAIAKQAGCDRAYTDLVPEDKLRIVQELEAEYGKVAMVGDGVNDAPALAQATVGIAMGGAGSEVALETADVVLVSDDLSKLPYAIRLGRRAKRIVTQNIAFSLSVIAVLVVTNFLELITLPIGVVGHEGSTVLVILNGLRMLYGSN